jgi:hypothetical protein
MPTLDDSVVPVLRRYLGRLDALLAKADFDRFHLYR